tara:strand:- start:35788 stop:36495 length:708 start_codon:yes stop_codon:yes gene_type:complete
MRTLKILGFLLSYPSTAHKEVLEECKMFLHKEDWLSKKAIKDLEKLMQEIEDQDLLDLQESYVELFDRTPSLSLHLFEHIHGDSRERGQALVDLTKVYEDAGLFMQNDETPDYLPLFLEYVSTLGADEIKDNMGSIVNITSALGERLKNRGSNYTSIFMALAETASRKADPAAIEDAIKKSSGEAYSFEQLDKEWEEQFAFENTSQTTGQNDGCPKAKDMLARIEGYKEEERVQK